MINNRFTNKNPYVVPEQSPLIILDSKSDFCKAKNGKDTKHTSHITIIIQFVRNGEGWKFHKPVWCEGGLQLVDIGTKNVRDDELNYILGYAMVIIDN